MRRALILAAILAAPCAAQELQPEPPIQEQLNKVVAVLNQDSPLHLNVAAIQELNALNESVSDKHEIVKQVAILATGPGEQQPLVALAIMDLLDLPPKIVIRVLAPHLDAENPKLRSFVRDWFQGHDNGGPNDDPLKPVNFEDYVDYVRGQQNPPAPFVEYIYGRSPWRALIVFYRGDRQRAITAIQAEAREVEAARQELEGGTPRQPAQRPQESERGILLAEQIVRHAIALKKWDNGKLLPEAKEQLAKLAEYDEWWVRLYVAEIMLRHPELRVPEVVEKLSSDGNASVSKAAKAAKG
jgi:hypothetical protein